MKRLTTAYRNVNVKVEPGRNYANKSVLNLYVSYNGNREFIASVADSPFIYFNFKDGININDINRIKFNATPDKKYASKHAIASNENAIKHIIDVVYDYMVYDFEYDFNVKAKRSKIRKTKYSKNSHVYLGYDMDLSM